jgi:UDP-N-acetyl-D-mannosaminuronic acid dehydrogenase
MTEPRTERILIYGFGYVGATLAAALVEQQRDVVVVEPIGAKIDAFHAERRMPFYEPHVDDLLLGGLGRNFSLVREVDGSAFDVAIVCVGTPIDRRSRQPDLEQVYLAAGDATRRLQPGGLLILRSTVPVGTTRRVAERHRADIAAKALDVGFCPERTIQGQALHEIKRLPQIVGGLTERARNAAAEFWRRLSVNVVSVSSADAAELVKLANNCHTDVIYGYGNQVALVAREHRLDPYEVIRAANLDYPRPDLHRPGFVGGSCLIKDPYLLLASVSEGTAGALQIVRAARQANEDYPHLVAEAVKRELLELRGRGGSGRLTVLFCGIAYKGQPLTDDVRGAPIERFLEVFGEEDYVRLGHDFLVAPQTLKRLGLEPVGMNGNIDREVDAVLFLNNHPDYARLDLGQFSRAGRPVYVLDAWCLFDRPREGELPQVVYRRLGDV